MHLSTDGSLRFSGKLANVSVAIICCCKEERFNYNSLRRIEKDSDRRITINRRESACVTDLSLQTDGLV
jgi:hypothetical protein